MEQSVSLTSVRAKADISGLNAAVVSLPFFTPFSTCYPMHLLGDILEQAGAAVRMFPANIDFYARFVRKQTDVAVYKSLTHRPYAADCAVLPHLGKYVDMPCEVDERFAVLADIAVPDLCRAGSDLGTMIDELVDQLAQRDVVLLTATHYQLSASLLLAYRLKERHPVVRIILGGYLASLDAAQALLDKHACLDGVVFGEAEPVLVEAVAAVVAGGPRRVVQGKADVHSLRRHMPRQDSIIEYVQQVPHIARRFQVSLEVSRGCYWDKCDFCNFNASYEGRFKSHDAELVLGEMVRLRKQHGQRRFQFLDTALPGTVGRVASTRATPSDFDIFCEVRPEFPREALVGLRQMGNIRLQVGIESLVDEHLLKMKKGATFASNVECLTTCKELDVVPTWGVMVGHPLETNEDLEQQIQAIKQCFHLPAPKYVTAFEFRAGSPLWEQRKELGYSVDFPFPEFEAILPLEPENSELVACVVRRDETSAERSKRRSLVREIENLVEDWAAVESGSASGALRSPSSVAAPAF